MTRAADLVDQLKGRWNLPIQLGEQGDELCLPLAHFRSSVDLPRAGIKSGKQMQRPCSFVAMLQARRLTRSSGKGGSQTRTWLQVGLLVDTYHYLFISQGTGVEINQVASLLRKVLITRNIWRKPEMMPPRFEFMRAQDPLNGVG